MNEDKLENFTDKKIRIDKNTALIKFIYTLRGILYIIYIYDFHSNVHNNTKGSDNFRFYFQVKNCNFRGFFYNFRLT